MPNKYSTLKGKFERLGNPKPNSTNYEGGATWKQGLEDQYTQLLRTEMFGNTYYADETKRLELGVKVIEDFVKQNPAKALEIAVEAREKYYMRTIPILALVYLTNEDIDLTNGFNKIVLTPRDAIQFIDLCRSGIARKGLGRKIKKHLNDILENWVKRKGEFYATKYKNQLKTIVKLAHPKINNVIVDYVMDNENVEWLPKTIVALNEIKKADLSEDEIIERIIKYRLDWNSLKGISKPTPKMWKQFLNNMSAIALIKNIATGERNLSDSDELLEILRKRLTVQNLSKGKVLPIRLMQAYKMVKIPDITRFLGMTANDYAREYNLSNLGVVAICPDVSGSMRDMANKNFSFGEMAGMFAGVLAKACKNSHFIAWDTQNYPLDRSRNDWRDVVFIYNNCKNAGGGGTFMNYPVEYLIENNIKVDTFIGLTDKEEWADVARQRAGYYRQYRYKLRAWFDAWVEYKQKVNPKARAILIRSDSYIQHQPFPPEVAGKYDIYQMFGYSDQVFNLLSQI